MHNYLEEQFGLDGQVAVVIGATGELGGAMAEGLCHAGADTVIAGRNAEVGEGRASSLHAASGGRGEAVFAQCDTTSKASLQHLRDQTVERFGQIDVVVNSAGVNSSTPFLEIEEQEWDEIMNVNLKGVFLSCQVFGKHLVEEERGGSIINISSMAGITPLSKVFTYAASKAALINLTKNLAREWAPQEIRVNCIAPGFFPAEQNRELLTEERTRDIMRHTPADRFGDAAELVGITLLLASGKAGSFITGANVPVDGGYSAMTI